jgi:hypothetical protein
LLSGVLFALKFIAQGQSINAAHHVEILKPLREAVRIKRPEPWLNDWILHHDNAPAYKALFVKQFVAQSSITKKKHPPYSPDLLPNDLQVFQE